MICYVRPFCRQSVRSSAVVKVLCYKSEGRWFDPSWCQWIFPLPPGYNPIAVNNNNNNNNYYYYYYYYSRSVDGEGGKKESKQPINMKIHKHCNLRT
jgi:hypothetical protein